MLKCIHQLFESQVARTPQAIAVVFGQKKLTYQKLNIKANQLAAHLQKLGVGAEVLVGICLDRSLEMIVGLLGILKAGGAYLPLDPVYPAERLGYMVRDAQLSVLVTQQKWSSLISDYSGKLICLDSQQDEIFNQSNTYHIVNPVEPNNLAYVIYTSGSTGKPKGVMIEHHSLVNFTQSAIAQYKISARDVILQFTSVSFDVFAEEIYPALSCGATVVLRTEETLSFVASFIQQSQDCQITVWDLPTSYWYLIVNELSTGKITLPKSLRLVIIGGERVVPEQVKKWLNYVGNFPELINAYGPTETTIEATICLLSSLKETQLQGKEIPIGKPIADNIQVYVLDQNLQQVPTQTIGEIYIGGAGLARGYLNRPELTAERFIKNPFNNSKLYKTGDLGRYLADGNLEFVARIDYQVKFNGFRIELEEIESVLNQHPQVSQTAVIVREDTPENKRLVAYIVPHQKTEINCTNLQSFLKNKLPSYMVPTVFVSLNTLPLNPNGKIDRQALPIPKLQETFVAPRNSQEEALAEIWCQVFGLEQIGVDDNFFQLGGHSLIATQILSRIRDVFQVELSFGELFGNSTINDLVKVIVEQQQLKKSSSLAKIQPIPREGYLPVSFAQERVYFIEQLAPSMSAYQFQDSLRFQGNLKISILEKSLSEILRRHEIFRTTFPAIEGKLVQVIHPYQPVNLAVIDLQNIPQSEQQAEIEKLTAEAVKKPFNLSELPLIRWTVLKLSNQEYVLVHVEHHMVHDGWSFNLFLQELLTLYQAFCEGKSSPLAEPSLQFADFAHWQRQWVLTEPAQAQLDYWKQKLAGCPPLLELVSVSDRPRTAEQTYQGGMLRMELPLDVCNALRNLSREAGVTLFMSMFAVFTIMLYRYTGQEDLCIGSGVANRRWRETEGLIGMIVNNIVLRTDISGNPTFRELLAQVRQVTLEAYANEDLPFDKVVEALKPERNLSYNPLFQVMFSFHDAPLPELRLPGLSIKQHETVNNQSAKFDLDIVVIPRSEQRVGRNSPEAKGIETDGITIVWEYNSDLFDPVTIDRMMGEYQTLVEGIVANPDQQISQYPLLTPEQQHQLLFDWNQTKTADPENKCIHQLVEEQVNKTPDAVAVVFEGQKLTYRELNEQANQLAHYLKNLGVKSDRLVGICIDRSLEMIVGLLGILKAGGAYVPLDPAYPAERLSDIVNDAHIPILVTMQQWATVKAEHSLQIVCLDTQKALICSQSRENPQSEVVGNNLAYVIYTSGSTGKPKGVLIEHYSLVNFTQTAIAEYKLTEWESVLQFASISFDTAAEEIYPCLISGGTLVLRTEEMLKSFSSFVQQSKQWGVTVWDLPTAYWHLLVNELASKNLSLPESLRLVILGGERVLPEKVAKWYQLVGNYPQLVNSYGPTETTVVATLSHLSENALNRQEITIGKPINNVQVYVLDKYLQPVPIGVPGELHIGGAGVARGYLNRPELTLQKFISNPFEKAAFRLDSPTRRSRLYKTGDLVRYQPDGNLEYLGRIDSQVKIRGFRIELGEIETMLNQHSHVDQAVVIAREDIPGNKRLIAYVVGNQGQIQIDEIRHFLKQKLPPYMIPSAFVLLEQLPITTNGKIDYRALPAPDTYNKNLNLGVIVPLTPTEEKLAAIWAEVLRQPNVSIYDNFFELGGDSIISIQMISRANLAGLELTPKQLFQYQTIAELATVVGTTRQIAANQGLVTGSVPLTPIQHWFFQQNLPDAHYFNQSALLEIPSETQPELLKQVLQQLLLHHDALRSRFAHLPESDCPQQINDPPQEIVPFTIVDLSELPPEAQQTAIKTKDGQIQASLNLSSGEIARFALFKLGMNQPSQLLFLIHHLVVDGISWRILLEDLATAYQQINCGQAIKLLPKTTSFQEWANRLKEYSKSADIAAQIDYWLSSIYAKIAHLPRDYPSNKEKNDLTSNQSFTLFLNEDETPALLQDVPSAYNTQINDVLLTALVQSFSKWTGDKSLIVDLEGHGREDLFEDVDLSRTVGWFTTLFTVQLELSCIDRLKDLKLIKEKLRLLPKHGIGYGTLRYLHPDAAVQNKFQNLPQAEVSFNYLGQFDQVLSASGMFGTVKEWKSEQSQRGNRSHLLAVSGLIHSGKLEIDFAYSDKVHNRSTIEQLAFGFMEALRNLISHCQSKESQGYTPCDFSAARLNQKQLDKFIAKLSKNKTKY
ncbi:amino acid adenylation domain-containing protein [Nostoc sp. CCCryo 231-06]|nr:amino acid adenylation domain-containing protein [Nostoc sp. CCCryo 231-06]